eukprot:5663146-Pleurochrysis_carterae.AAC.2
MCPFSPTSLPSRTCSPSESVLPIAYSGVRNPKPHLSPLSPLTPLLPQGSQPSHPTAVGTIINYPRAPLFDARDCSISSRSRKPPRDAPRSISASSAVSFDGSSSSCLACAMACPRGNEILFAGFMMVAQMSELNVDGQILHQMPPSCLSERRAASLSRQQQMLP